MSHPLIHTLLHLRPRQIFFQVLRRLRKAPFRVVEAPREGSVEMVAPIEKYRCLEGETFTFLNLSAPFTSWNATENGMLWAYNLNYMDFLGQEGMDFRTGGRWIEDFIANLGEKGTNAPQSKEEKHKTPLDTRIRIGLDPYPIALRGINWIKFITAHNSEINEAQRKRWNDSLFSQYLLLTKKLEYHLLGNHLLEDAFSLFVAAIYFADPSFYRTAKRLLEEELREQVLPDGAHYEQSPMYHCILLDRLLDCLNLSQNNNRFSDQERLTAFLRSTAVRMLGHLESICFRDGTYPLLNDAANGIAPTPEAIKDYARRLGLTWEAIPLSTCGYRHFLTPRMEAFVDAGAITATYQPGHTHSDALSFCLCLDGRPLIVDTGISTYNKTARRQYERSALAHNTVIIDHVDPTQVWGGFRVGYRPHITLLAEDAQSLTAEVKSQGKRHRRTFTFTDDDTLTIHDQVLHGTSATGILHLAPTESVRSHNLTEIVTSSVRITLSGATRVDIVEEQCSVEYNRFLPSAVIKIAFTRELVITIQT